MTITAELPDGRRLEFPDGTSQDVIQSAVKQQLGAAAPGEPAPGERTPEQRQARIAALEAERAAVEVDQPGALQGAAEVVGGTLADLRGVPEAATQIISGGLASAAGGAAAIPVTALEALRGGEDPAGAGRAVVEEFQDRFTFQPRTEVGQRATESIQAPLESFEQLADRIGEETGESGDVLGATLVKTAILGAPALFGLRRGGVTRKAPTKPTPKQEVAAAAAEEGYVTPPSVRGEGGAAGLAEGVGGKLKTGQQAIETNQSVTNNLAARAVGLPEGTPLSIEILQGVRAQAGQAFEAIRDVGQVITDTVFRKDLSAATARFRSAAKDFPELAKSEIIDIVDGLRVAQFDAASGIDAMSLLRNKADVAFRGGDKTLGNAYRAASDAIESVVERHLSRGDSVALLDEFRSARQQIAETYSVEQALRAGNMEVGNVNAGNLSAQLKKGKPLTGDLRSIADFANTFPSVSRLSTGTTPLFSPLDLFGVGTTGLGGAAAASSLGPAALIPAALQLSRPLLRRGALSEVARVRGLEAAGAEAVSPSGAALTGAAASGGLSQIGRN